MKIKGARVLITGASGGLGTEVVAQLVAKGARVVGLDKASPEISNWRGAKFLQCDITNQDEVASSISNAAHVLGGIDLLINNAGTLVLQDAASRPTKLTQDGFDSNFWGLWRVTAAALPYLRASHGKLINISSLFAYVNAPLVPGYSTSKRAVAALSDSLRMQYGNEITVTTLYPGFMRTGVHSDAVRQGLEVGKIVDIRFLGIPIINLEEHVHKAARGVVRACERKYRDAALTWLGSLQLWSARHTPALVDFIIGTRVAHLIQRGTLTIKLDESIADS